ncbi:GyrI-like domain-containing protein [Bacillus horti]|uniref:Transcriptional regulator YdeE n=1 Tax=Caldalkalibacillus horti TaxID=77523 RepID=A0ABT9VWN6_9BACI|nr:GyrI-like domain-containing protein [Bacillus horti]MDQ0165406.1 putative transcriptional regulator YdeE [Bacillus horti]
MGEPMKKNVDKANRPEGYKPQSIPGALKLLQNKIEKRGTEAVMSAEVVTVESFKLLVLKANGSMEGSGLGKDIRRAWQELKNKLVNDSLAIDAEVGYVLYDQGHMQQPDGSLDAWVGVKVDSFDNAPAGVEQMVLPTRKYAKTSCQCKGREKMGERYQFLGKWIEQEGHQVDYNLGAFTLEPNYLNSINTFEIPADEVHEYDFDILYPIISL